MSDDLPKGSPRPAKILYIAVGSGAALLSVAALGLNAIPPFKDAMFSSGRAIHLISPPPVNDVGSLSTGWMPSGSTWASASQPYVEHARVLNPDYIVTFHPGREYSKSGPFNTNVEYRFQGTLTYEPRWKGII